MQKEIARDWNHLDALICCAGLQGPLGPAMKLSPQDWSRSLHVNLHGTFNTLLATHDLLARAPRRGKIVCFSGGGATAPRPFFTPYAGLGRVWIESDPHGTAGLRKEEFSLSKAFVGVGMNFAVINFNFEADKTGEVSSYSVKMGLRF